MSTWSKSSPPRCVSPLTPLTSKTPSPVQDGDVERAAAQVEDGDLLVFLLVQAIRQRGRGRLVDDTHALPGLLAGLGVLDLPFGIEAGDLGGVDGRLALGVVEV